MTATSPTSPSTPGRKHRSLRLSSFDDSFESTSRSAYASGTTNGTIFSRRSSRTSQTSYQPRSPVTPRRLSSRASKQSLHGRKSSRTSLNSINSGNSFELQDPSGLGNLADELGQTWDQDETQGSSFLEGLREGDIEDNSAIIDIQSPDEMNDMHDFGFGIGPQSPLSTTNSIRHQDSTCLSPRKSVYRQTRHQRQDSAYDGSDYGPESDIEEQLDGFPPIVRKQIREIEKLTRASISTDDTVSEGGGVVKRAIHALKDLGPQSNIEYGITRMVTAYTSMATHRTHKQRDIFSQSHSLLYGGSLDLSEEVIDPVLSEISSLSSTMSFIPTQNPLLSLQILASQTTELTQTLRSITDTLQESRLATNAATRKLKTVKDMVEDMRLEEELVENSMMLIQAGDWDRRCRLRQAAQTCREVVNGFADRWGLDTVWNEDGTSIGIEQGGIEVTAA